MRRHSYDAPGSAIWTRPILSGIDAGKTGDPFVPCIVPTRRHDVAKVVFDARFKKNGVRGSFNGTGRNGPWHLFSHC
jgi:hypothetical protein